MQTERERKLTQPGLETEPSDTRGGAPRPKCLAVSPPRDPSLGAGNILQFTCLSPHPALGRPKHRSFAPLSESKAFVYLYWTWSISPLDVLPSPAAGNIPSLWLIPSSSRSPSLQRLAFSRILNVASFLEYVS